MHYRLTLTLIEKETIVCKDNEVSEIFSEFFNNAVKELNIEPWDPDFIFQDGDDIILGILKKI